MKTTDEEPAGSDLDLSPAQERAIEARVAGGNWTEAAEAADVDRTTVWRWRKKDAHFQAALNRQREELRDAISRDLRRAAEGAAAAVALKVSEGDAHLGLQLLRAMDLLGPEPLLAGSTDPEKIKRQLAYEESRKEHKEELRAQFEAWDEDFETRLEDLKANLGGAAPPDPPEDVRPSRSEGSAEAEDGGDVEEPADGRDKEEAG